MIVLKKIPAKSGVYAIEDWDGMIIYVGSTTNLRRRFSQHLTSDVNIINLDPYEVQNIYYLRTTKQNNMALLEQQLIYQVANSAKNLLTKTLKNKKVTAPVVNLEPIDLTIFEKRVVWDDTEAANHLTTYKQRREWRSLLAF
jgi:predicted GIY-YIG superfamily endonuclease